MPAAEPTVFPGLLVISLDSYERQPICTIIEHKLSSIVSYVFGQSTSLLAATVRLSDFHRGALGEKGKPMDHIELGKRLRASRDSADMSQQDVADRLKLPRTAISL